MCGLRLFPAVVLREPASLKRSSLGRRGRPGFADSCLLCGFVFGFAATVPLVRTVFVALRSDLVGNDHPGQRRSVGGHLWSAISLAVMLAHSEWARIHASSTPPGENIMWQVITVLQPLCVVILSSLFVLVGGLQARAAGEYVGSQFTDGSVYSEIVVKDSVTAIPFP